MNLLFRRKTLAHCQKICSHSQITGSHPCPTPVPSQPTQSSKTKEPDRANSGSNPCPTAVPSKPTLSSGTKKKVPIGSTCTNDDAKVPRSVKKTMSWDMIKGRKHLVKFYTGCPTAETFMFIVDHVRPKHKKLQYYRGLSCTKQYIEHSMNTDAQYQTYSTYKSHNTLKKYIFHQVQVNIIPITNICWLLQ